MINVLGRLLPVHLRLRLVQILILAPAVSLVLLACRGGGDEAAMGGVQGDTAATRLEDLPLVEVPTLWATWKATDLRTLVASADVVFVGNVTGLQGQRSEELLPSSSGHGGPTPQPLPISLFDIRVDRVILGDVSQGSMVTIEQVGGTSLRSDGTQIRLIPELDQFLEAGRTYLFFASRKDNGSFAAAPFGRLKVGDDGRLAELRAWGSLGAIQVLTGLQVDEVEREITSAGAQ